MSKMSFKSAKFLALVSFFLLAKSVLPAENFRVRKIHFALLEDSPSSESTFVTGINDSICVKFPENHEFIEGIEVKVQIPSAVSSWQDSVAFSLYDNVSPVPRENLIDYSGTRLFLQPLPSKVYWIAQIPLSKNASSIKDSAYTTKINVIPNIKSGFSFIRFMQVMKGVPEETLNSHLTVTVKPCLSDMGRMTIFLEGENSDAIHPVDVFMDGKTILSHFEGKTHSALMKPGLYNLNVQSSDYRNEVRSVVVEQAKNTFVRISLKSLQPRLSVTAPDNADIFLDGKKITETGKDFEISEGEHRIRFVLGNYEVIRNISAEKGKSYAANLNVDLKISEE